MDKLSVADQKATSAIIEEITDDYKNGRVSLKVHTSTIVNVMEFMELVHGLNGGEKKELVVYVFKEVAKQVGDIDVDFELIEETIDIIVGLSRGKFDLNKFKGCLGMVRKNLAKNNYNCLKACC